ncbi:Hypothetical protein PHPALM_18995, partial [Phytophthora palmivora]
MADNQSVSAASEEVHASALAMLAESSAARTEKNVEARPLTEEEHAGAMEHVRVKIEKARVRVGTSVANIPAGRVYDSPPDASDEPVYDALEKAYNAAFLVHPPAGAEHVPKEESVVRHEKLGTTDSEKAVKSELQDVDKDGSEDATKVGTLKSMCLSTMQEHTDNGEQSELNDEHNDPGVTFDYIGRDNCIPTAVADMTMKPEITEEARIERADHLSLNEFLISELEVYCSQLLERESPRKESSGASGLARITGLQLYQDHQRALMDFDDEWK